MAHDVEQNPNKRKALVLVAVLVLAMLLALAVAGVARAGRQGLAAATVIYNLYATDGYQSSRPTGRRSTCMVRRRTARRATDLPAACHHHEACQTVATARDPRRHRDRARRLTCPHGGPVATAEAQFAGNAQFPAPMIYATTGDVVQIRMKNLGVSVATAPDDPHSIHLHGMDVPAANDGVPETSVGAVSAGAVDGLGNPIPGRGNVVVYMFVPQTAGTYFYHCHQEADIHVQMGMYGALVVYNPTDAARTLGPGRNQSGTLDGWTYDKDYVLLLSEIDTRQHGSEQTSGTFNPVDYKPQYWMVNGISFPQTIHVGMPGNTWGNWLASHPGYDPFIVGSVGKTHPASSGVPVGDKVLLRVINMGFETQPWHMHGFHGKIIGSDQRAWPWANLGNIASATPTPWGQGLEKNTLTIGSGETYEWLVNFGLQSVTSTYDPGTQTRYDPTTGLPLSNTTTGTVINDPGGAPYIGGPTVSGAVGFPQTGQLFPFHNHDDYKATNNGVYPGGQFTMIMTPP